MFSSFISEFKSLPNMITSIRFILAPFLLYFAFINELYLFTLLFYICAISDYIDGPIARRFNSTSELGSFLDNLADELLLLSGLAFMYLLRPEIMLDNLTLFVGFLTIYFLERMLFYGLQKGKPRLHLYSGKTFARAYYLFLPVMFYVINYMPILYLILSLGTITLIEQSAIYIKYKEVDAEMKSLINPKYNPLSYIYKLPF
ncbi:MAG: phosphatidylglycerophosphate synthetase [Candidatus Methanofastidiosum methylothiophilum]|uniref:Phosphatidylglycerophosphate synthetase n=1 Tax=Candidatus Methanofastidiosum methylothiophilum TaxID=1705564 RepID=A0A150J156_9EURY|nr:MAG: phosphatidylglycerophosphate synthetase [Candidatus Methanofastidiosum methylthiophilus]KYC48160.1 MAG: phosphatidylglycerophosphate synthetase [Candidatus Methanofastidiosum methylthiophilus]KYC50815.1 MAG: phosphatidylglycerophosphate synthetase [Candidatus Methanofastidiosum methylthiophilus]